MTTGGGDRRLSELTDDLLRRILYFAPSKEAASTSLLSRRWGSLWRSSGAVNLDVHVQGYEHLRSYGYCYGRSDSDDGGYQEAEEAFFATQEAFVRGAMAALDAAEAPLTRLTLRVESDGGFGATERPISQFLTSTRDGKLDVVGAVVSHPAARHVQELRVAAADASDYLYLGEESQGRGPAAGVYELACLPSSATLRVLDLTSCDLAQSSPALMAALPIPWLATLRLRFCPVERKALQALLDAAPELATVHLESLFFVAPPGSKKAKPYHTWGHYAYVEDGDTTAAEEPPVLRLRFQAATTLVLTLCGMEVVQKEASRDRHGHGTGRWAIEIDAPRLQSFKYKGLMRGFVLRSAAPGVARVDLHFLRQKPNERYHPQYVDSGNDDEEEETTQMLFWQFLHNFTNARTLKLKVGNELKDIAVVGKALRARLLCAFPRVERLELEGVHDPKSKTAAVAIANLLRCCPALGEIVLKLSTATGLRDRGSRYGKEFLERKDRADYNKSMDRFVRRRKPKTAMSSMEEDSSFFSGDNKYGDVPCIPGLSGRPFACLQRSLRRVGLQFRLDDNSISTCLGLRLMKFFADHAMVLEEMCVDTGNRRLDEHLNFIVRTQVALAARASIQHKNLAESSSELSKSSSVSLVSTIDLAKTTLGFTLLPLQRQERIDCKS